VRTANDDVNPVVEIRGLTVRFDGPRPVHAVNGVDLTVEAGEVLALLGESGSGKSVTLRSLMRLHREPATRYGGQIRVCGRDVLAMRQAELADYRGPVCAMVFQEPLLAFDPVYTIGDQIAEVVRRHEGAGASAARTRAIELLDQVQIPQARQRYRSYPHEVSGGMRQRAMIALALSCRPRLLLADEPTTALDATVQVQILQLLKDLQRELAMSVIFVTHDIGVAARVAERMAVMYAGRIVEDGPTDDLIRAPLHPYTEGLLASTVVGAMRGRRLPAIRGSPPDLSDLPSGCAFAARCDRVTEACRSGTPPRLVSGGRSVACLESGLVSSAA
jgi:peptide/nickel transport system ATP-binding protein